MADEVELDQKRMGDDNPYPLLKLFGDENPYPLGTKPAGKWVAGQGVYRATQLGPIVRVYANVEVDDSHGDAQLSKTIIEVVPPQFAVVIFKPSEPSSKTKKVDAVASFISENWIERVTVYDSSGKQSVLVFPVTGTGPS